jgi:hypothetical protein
MSSGDTSPPFEVLRTGTPLDYSEDLYGFYVETVDIDGTAERALRDFLGPRHAERLRRLAHGFEFAAPIQCAPDLIRLLTQQNIAVYQLVRRAKVEGSWR